MSVRIVWVFSVCLGIIVTGCYRQPISVIAAPTATILDESTPEGLIKAAELAINASNGLEAIAKYEAALELDPHHRKALAGLILVKQILAGDATKRNDKAAILDLYLQVGALARRLNQPPQEPSQAELALINVALYNEACAFSLQMQLEKALVPLEEAIASGFQDLTLLESDPDLTPLRREPKFTAILAKAQNRAREKAKEVAETLLAEVPPYPLDFTVADPDGKSVHLAEVKGDVTILNLWGTWCGPCRQQVGQLVGLANSQKATNLVILGLNFEDGPPKEVQATVRKFLADSKLPYRCLIGDDTVLEAILDMKGYPTTLFLDASGQVRARLLGYQDRFVLEAIVKAIRAESAAKAE